MKFVPCSLEEFDHVERKVEEGTYQFNLIEYQKFSVPSYKRWIDGLDPTQRL